MLSLNTLYCTKCGGTYSGGYACEPGATFISLEQLWNDFAEIPIDEDENIVVSFYWFPIGTSKYDIWHWFDERCPNNLHDDLLY